MKYLNHRDTEAQRKNKENCSGFSLCLCVSVVKGLIHG